MPRNSQFLKQANYKCRQCRSLPQKIYGFISALIASCLFVVVCPGLGYSQEYLSESSAAPIALHLKRRAGRKIVVGSKGVNALWGRKFSANLVYSQAQEKQPLATCKNSRLLRKEIFSQARLANALDVVFYSSTIAQQSQQAKHSLLETQSYEELTEGSIWNSVAKLAKLNCLPTRFVFSTIAGRRFLELREGEAAWVVDEQARSEQDSTEVNTGSKSSYDF